MNYQPGRWTVSNPGRDVVIVGDAGLHRRVLIRNDGPGAILPVGDVGPLSGPVLANMSVHVESERLTVHNLGPGPASGSVELTAIANAA
jgi:hypothetical protein